MLIQIFSSVYGPFLSAYTVAEARSTCCKLTTGVETVLKCIYSDFMLSVLTIPSLSCRGGSSKTLNSFHYS